MIHTNMFEVKRKSIYSRLLDTVGNGNSLAVSATLDSG